MVPFSEYLPIKRQRDYIYFSNTELIPDLGLTMTFKHYYKTKNTFFKDSLLVQYSIDCGDSWISAFEVGDSTMVTTVLDDVSNPDYWMGDTVEVYGLVRIVGVNGFGGDLYLDDIRFNEMGVGIRKAGTPIPMEVLPNPTSSHVLISWEGNGEGMIQVCGLEGRTMHQELSTRSQTHVDVSNWPAGVYLIQLQTKKGVATQTLVVTK
jgi:hypothetical protein